MPLPDPGGDPNRWCLYCQADCYPDEPEHALSCPVVTGLWPVIEQDLTHGILCMDCREPLGLGDFYVMRDVESGSVIATPVNMGVYELICVGCGALNV